MELVKPDWPALANVRAFTTTRAGGYSKDAWSSMNLGLRCGDDPLAVHRNREKLLSRLPVAPQWLRQVHGTQVVTHSLAGSEELEGDGLVSFSPGQVCAVLTADCLPVLFCNRSGNRVAAAHAGWRGLAQGVLQATVRQMKETPGEIMSWLGPAIGPGVYQVGEDVRQAFEQEQGICFKKNGERWLLDLYGVARRILSQLGITAVYGGHFCTFSDSERFFSYRRDKVTGRMASVIWLELPKH
ncbi:MAG: peptidoglycan editing factor PgeF [Xanthomonadales bacterium]